LPTRSTTITSLVLSSRRAAARSPAKPQISKDRGIQRLVRRPFQLEIEIARDAGLIDHRPAEIPRQTRGQTAHRQSRSIHHDRSAIRVFAHARLRIASIGLQLKTILRDPEIVFRLLALDAVILKSESNDQQRLEKLRNVVRVTQRRLPFSPRCCK